MSEQNKPGPEFLKGKYDLHKSEEATSAARRTEKRTGEKVSQDPHEQIQNYLDRFSEILNRDDPDKRQHGIRALKRLLHSKFVIKPEDIPQSYYDLQGRIAEERGQRAELEDAGIRIEEYQDKRGETKKHYHYPERLKQEFNESVVIDQEYSLDNWIDYLSSSDANHYPDWLKYYAVQGMLQLGAYNKEIKQFEQRRPNTVKPFPDLNREALAYVLDALEKKYQPEYFRLRQELRETAAAYQQQRILEAVASGKVQPARSKKVVRIELDDGKIINLEKRSLELLKEQSGDFVLTSKELIDKQYQLKQEFSVFLQDNNLPESFQDPLKQEDFGKLYAWALEKVTPASAEELSNVSGEWVVYKQGSDHMKLVKTLQGKGTGWCTAGESTAKSQLEAGDFHVFYSYDDEDKATVPRLAFRMEGNKIAEIRGIAHEQNIDSGIARTSIINDKLAEFGTEGERYQKKAEDMKFLTEIGNKAKAGEALDRDDLAFLYELDHEIQGFGYQRDPRIEELRGQRNPEEDVLIVFNCNKEQIANNLDEVTKDTKAYFGKLQPGIFDKIAQHNIEHVYTKFPENKIQRYQIVAGGKDASQLEKEFKAKDIYIDNWAKDLLNHPDFESDRLKEAKEVRLVRLTVGDLGFPQGATTDQIYTKGLELGLKLNSPDIGPVLRLQSDDPRWMVVAMKQIVDRGGGLDVFCLRSSGGRLKLSADNAMPGSGWFSGREFVFQQVIT